MDDRRLLPGRKLAFEKLGDVLILGLGVSGKACVRYLVSKASGRMSSLTVYAGSHNETVDAWLDSISSLLDECDDNCSVEFVFDCEDVAGSFDLCIASPGISEFSEFYASAKSASAEVISEVEFAWRESDACAKWIAITGTNGKTTTTALTGFILRNAGVEVRVVGNIGDAAISAVADDMGSAVASNVVYVVETSSYQLASTKNFAPDVAVVLGITPDHLAWHKSHENYALAKWKILNNLGSVSGACAILDATNDEVRAKVRELKAMGADKRGFSYIPLGTKRGIDFDMREACSSENAAFEDAAEGVLCVAYEGVEHRLAEASQMKLKGKHNIVNSLAAASAAVVCAIDDNVISKSLTEFAPLEHRIEPCGCFNGIDFYNDSKATNVDATLVALEAFLPKKPIVMFGGRDKGTDLSPLIEACRNYTSGAVCFGEAGERFFEALSSIDCDSYILERVTDFDSAFKKACELARTGDVVLLSPACASFDEFACFEERGEHFKELVRSFGAVER